MTTELTVKDTSTEAEQVQGAAAGTPDAAVSAAAAPPSFTTEQQAHIDKLISDRLKRERDKQQAAIDKAKADAEASQAAERGEFQRLYETEKANRAEAEARLAQMEHDQQRRDAAQAAGIAPLWQRLQGSTPEELAEDAKALAAMMQPAQPGNGQPARQATQPTPAPQGRNGLTDEERRARATKTW